MTELLLLSRGGMVLRFGPIALFSPVSAGCEAGERTRATSGIHPKKFVSEVPHERLVLVSLLHTTHVLFLQFHLYPFVRSHGTPVKDLFLRGSVTLAKTNKTEPETRFPAFHHVILLGFLAAVCN